MKLSIGVVVLGALACASSKSMQSGSDASTPGATGGGSGGAGSGGTVGSGGVVGSGGAAGGGTGGTTMGGTGGVTMGGTGGMPAGACPPLVLNANTNVATFDTDQFVWRDSACKPRQAAMVRVGGGYVRQFVYDVDGKPRTVTGTGANGHTGFGYTVNHWGNTATVGRGVPGTFKPLFVGRHHAVYEYAFKVAIAGKDVPVTQHWFFATGRDNPVLATTYDASAFPPGSLGTADNRTPYGDLAWDGDENARSTVVDGVAWGDRYKFTTTSAPLTMNSKWDYSKPNVVPYVLAWTVKTDAEMGIVQTQTQLQHDAGGYWFYDNWGKTSDNQAPRKNGQIGLMTPTWNWTYQINQYELCIENPACVDNPTGSHRLAWGANYGAVGGANAGPTYAAYGDDKMISGHPFQSHSVFMVLGKHSAGPVFRQAVEIERVQNTRLEASAGTVKAMGPGGVGRTDLVALAPAGYDHRYAVWSLEAAANRVAVKLIVGEGSLSNPVLLIAGYTAASAPSVKVDGQARVADADYLASVDPAGKQVWITLRGDWTGSHDLEIQ